MKVTLVEVNKGLRKPERMVSPSGMIDPLAIEYLGAYVQNEGHMVSLIQERAETQGELAEKIISTSPDVLGISCMTHAFYSAREIAEKVKRKLPRVINVFGGYHVSAVHEEDVARDIWQPIDYVVRGEGEETFSNLLGCLESEADSENIWGTAFRKGRSLVINPIRERIKKLESLPWPLRKEEFMHGNKTMGLTVLPSPSKQVSYAQASYSRGCPNNCSYCSSPTTMGREVTFRSPGDLVSELECLKKEFGTNLVYFTDLTFNLNKNKVRQLCDEIKKRNLDMSLFVMCQPDADESLMREMRESGFKRISWGVEAFTERDLDALNRKKSFEETLESIRIGDRLGISTRGYLMLGFEQESFGSYESYVRDCIHGMKRLAKAGLDEIRLSFVTPFPGTPLYGMCKAGNLLLTKDFSQYTSEVPIIRHRELTAEQQVRAREEIFYGFYNSPEYQRHIKDKLQRCPEMRQAYGEVMGWLKSKKDITGFGLSGGFARVRDMLRNCEITGERK